MLPAAPLRRRMREALSPPRIFVKTLNYNNCLRWIKGETSREGEGRAWVAGIVSCVWMRRRGSERPELSSAHLTRTPPIHPTFSFSQSLP